MKFKLLTLIFLVVVSSVCYSFLGNRFSNQYVINNPDSSNKLGAGLLPIVNQTFEELKVPGAIIGVWMGGYEPWKTTLGVADLKTMQPIMLNDKMRIGSITKTFTGTVLLQLVDEGKISLSDKLNKYFPDFPNGQNITIEEVGNMTSGIYNYSEDSTFGATLTNSLTTSFTPLELIDIAEKHKPYFDPGKGMHYSNTNFILLGLIIEKITGNPLQTEIQNRILNPLGMTNSNLPESPRTWLYVYGFFSCPAN
jgi:D-alanyl-D-alanine carboxypeptidase